MDFYCGLHECCDPTGGVGALCNFPCARFTRPMYDENPAGGITTRTMSLDQGGGAGVWQVGGGYEHIADNASDDCVLTDREINANIYRNLTRGQAEGILVRFGLKQGCFLLREKKFQDSATTVVSTVLSMCTDPAKPSYAHHALALTGAGSQRAYLLNNKALSKRCTTLEETLAHLRSGHGNTNVPHPDVRIRYVGVPGYSLATYC